MTTSQVLIPVKVDIEVNVDTGNAVPAQQSAEMQARAEHVIEVYTDYILRGVNAPTRKKPMKREVAA